MLSKSKLIRRYHMDQLPQMLRERISFVKEMYVIPLKQTCIHKIRPIHQLGYNYGMP
jgi:hypothetical protein